jgi:hypothetical protein
MLCCTILRIVYIVHVMPGTADYDLSNLLSICCNGRLNVGTVVRLTVTKFKPITSPVLGFAYSPLAKMYILTILYDLCLLPA